MAQQIFEQNENSQRDSDFGYYDHIDVEEECAGGERAIRYSIKCLDFQMMIAEKSLLDIINKKQSSGSKKASLLNRASSLMANSNSHSNSRTSINNIKKLNEVTKILN